MTTILSIFGSPRKDGNTSTLHHSFLKPFAADFFVKKIHVYDLTIHPCTGCGKCKDRFGCVFDDDMDELYSDLMDAALITISSPLYFSSLTGPLKTFIDRCQVIWEYTQREGQPSGSRFGFFISAGGSSYRDMFSPSVTVIRHFFNTLNCGYNEDEYLLISGMEQHQAMPDGLLKDAEGLGEGYLSRITEKEL